MDIRFFSIASARRLVRGFANLVLILPGLLLSSVGLAQTKPTPPPAAIVAMIEGVTGQQFVPDTAYAAFSDEDSQLLTKEPVANWSLLQESNNMAYSNLVVGTRSYQLVVTRLAKAAHPTAMLVRYATPQSKPEPIVRGELHPKTEAKPKADVKPK